MMTDLLFLAGPNQAHWRYSQRADVLLLFMLPAANADAASKLTQHYLRLVLSQLPSQRSLGLTGLLVLLRANEDTTEVHLVKVPLHCKCSRSAQQLKRFGACTCKICTQQTAVGIAIIAG